MNNDILLKLLKYIAQGAIIYLVLKYVVKDMKDQDALLLTLIIVLSYAVFETLTNMVNGNQISNSYQKLEPSCVTTCRRENMENVSSASIESNTKSVLSGLSSLVSSATPSDSEKSVASEPNVAEINEKLRNMDQKSRDAIFKELTKNSVTQPMFTERENKTELNKIDTQPRVDFNTLPSDNGLEVSSEYGETFLPPKDWYPVPPHPPVCKPERSCPVCPVYTIGSPVDVREVNFN